MMLGFVLMQAITARTAGMKYSDLLKNARASMLAKH